MSSRSRVSAGARAVVLTPAATKIHSMPGGGRAEQSISAKVDSAGSLEIYPTLSIPFRAGGLSPERRGRPGARRPLRLARSVVRRTRLDRRAICLPAHLFTAADRPRRLAALPRCVGAPTRRARRFGLGHPRADHALLLWLLVRSHSPLAGRRRAYGRGRLGNASSGWVVRPRPVPRRRLIRDGARRCPSANLRRLGDGAFSASAIHALAAVQAPKPREKKTPGREAGGSGIRGSLGFRG